MPVGGLVVGQSPAPGQAVRQFGTLTMQVWHPPTAHAIARTIATVRSHCPQHWLCHWLRVTTRPTKSAAR